MDFAKYTPQADRYCLDAVFTSISQSGGQRIKYTRLGGGYSSPTLKNAFDLRCLANVARKVPSVDPSGLPLGATASSKTFKALMLDIGLMRHLSGMPSETEYAKNDLHSIYRGVMAEQFVGQEMTVSQNGSIYYWARQAKSSSAEVDYLAVLNGTIHPIEVKSCAAGSLKSLHLFMETYRNCGNALVFSMHPFAEMPEQRISFIPLYCAYAAPGGKGCCTSQTFFPCFQVHSNYRHHLIRV